ncbi:hypothetical protein BU25DRAFT_494798 [Macroventuria anomochaeta]|uniref:Uncharacterized protein n=1 Tax=Macroventuria anomochaeta TaxID=301207 RepID=A0ACB6RMS3_9PLEO|nr:uncharacterized protein BU25DRAFT_494798 [Macroventuria anomochaeta]KAF2622705.1 hypothetical protein BU25DRAFT_494798 [Macroventuria anomochaeta]
MAQQQSDMQLAEILSDLVSLRPGVCDPAAALALVSARPSASSTAATTTTTTMSSTNPSTAPDDDQDVDLQRAKELVKLHYEVRERCKRGELGRGLAEARRDVERAMGG